ncbi:hypothetical protein EPA93_23450 [Ktedonosporobacter rubrisoli]|uniref:Uncharacterized protein n=2 Tax=Ktedonosporobacter rubrisoli TaxID=2509675 RepID=A0A4P6K5C5_KTERU|nr:hypothetical protein EPA93_23450 [Ktedonosporobacter rubrisoli]
MKKYEGSCRLSQQQLIDEYFMDVRAKLLDVAAFLDRIDRSVECNAEEDFRMMAMREGLQALCTRAPYRVRTIQMIFSDPTREPLSELDRKSAFGAYDYHRDKEGLR